MYVYYNNALSNCLFVGASFANFYCRNEIIQEHFENLLELEVSKKVFETFFALYSTTLIVLIT